MMGYKDIFQRAEMEAGVDDYYERTFETFHDHPQLFHFIMAPEYETHDEGALTQAKQIDPVIAQMLIDKGPSKLGNGQQDVIDGVECRHILLLTYLISRLGTNWWGSVVEIGGGYGNFLRLVHDIVDYHDWTIIDLEHVSELQMWFLSRVPSVVDVYFLTAPKGMYSFANNDDDSIDLVLGVHSLSEFAMDDFIEYFNEVISKAGWFFYVSQQSAPSRELLQAKWDLIHTKFFLYDSLEYEGGTSIMHLFRNRGAI